MANFFSASPEEQIDLLSVWWDKYKYILGMLLAASVIFIVYRDYSISSSNVNEFESARLYDDFLSSTLTDKKTKAKEIIDLYSDTLYADFAALHLAKIGVEESNLEQAEQHLNWVIARSSSWDSKFNPVRSIAKLRLAKIFLEQDSPQAALDLLKEEKTLTASLFEVRGDAERSLNQINKAKLSYLQALELSNSQPIKSLISMKISDLQEDG
ncbi:MAG TPA: tetratricopeptide repeat protein [Gammaproteobacteria bacterium]|jgi:predicted negative regulator of RcsB-dependent stress response|nr:tetratricopeptide repeat protein [Gammaproteobacteria bacterium]HIK73022.1 tetratricopeptide repeat protein [Gammaproteobacteria bacterium]